MMKKTPERQLDVIVQDGIRLLEPENATAMDYDCVVLTQMLGKRKLQHLVNTILLERQCGLAQCCDPCTSSNRGSVASYLIYADVRTFRWLIIMTGRDYEFPWLAEWRKQNPNLLVINDRVQGGPITREDKSCSDVSLYSVGKC